MAKILVIDDEQFTRQSVSIILSNEGHQIDVAENGLEGIDLQKEYNYDLVITDVLMPEKEGLETLQELKASYPNLKVIVMSGGERLGNRDYLPTATLFGADDIIQKPFTDAQIIDSVTKCLTQH
jgi:YesN/AraC family two-component response regulator